MEIQAGPRVGSGLQPSGIRDRVRAAVQRAKRGKESALARRRRTQGDRALGKGGGAAERLTPPRIATGSTDKGIAPGGERQSPVAHRAARIRRNHRLKRGQTLFPPERVQQRHATLESALCIRAAGRRKHHVAELFGGSPVVVLGPERGGDQDRREREETGKSSHEPL